MKDLLNYIVKNLVENQDKVEITEDEADGLVNITLKVDQADMGRIIGKEGKIISSIRTLLHTRATKEGKKVNFQLLSEEEPKEKKD